MKTQNIFRNSLAGFFLLVASLCGYSQIINTIAGNGTQGFAGDGGAATAAELNQPMNTAFDAAGNMYIQDGSNNRVRKISPSGIITTVAGNGTRGTSGDGGLATSAKLYFVFVSMTVDSAGNIYLPDSNCIRMVNTSGIINTIAGTRIAGFSGDGGPATSARMKSANGIAVDRKGNVYFCDGNRIRMINTSGIINTIVGNGTAGFTGDGGLASAAQVSSPGGLAVDTAGNLYINDQGNVRIRKVDKTGIITTIAGTGTVGTTGDGGPAISAEINTPNYDLAVDLQGNIYFPDNNRLRKITAATGIISTIAGTGATGFSGDGGPATAATFFNLISVSVDKFGKVFITDNYNHRVRLVCNAPTFTITPSNPKVCIGSSLTFTVSGASTYTWSPSATLSNANSANPVASPTANTTYSVIGTDAIGCPNFTPKVTTLTVNPLPGMAIGVLPSASVCAMSAITLSVSGTATSYTWATGATTTSISATPSVTSVYTVTGTDANGCVKAMTKTVTVYALPSVAVNSPTLCSGGSTVLTASGASTYTWSTSATTNTISVTPANTTQYTVTGTGLHSCKNTATATVTIDIPPVSVNDAVICQGGSTFLNANGALSYTWTPATGLSSTNGSPVTANPNTTTVYYVTGTDANGCTNFDSSTVTVMSNPTITANYASICAGSTATLTANGAMTYTWSPPTGLSSSTGSTVVASPTATIEYTVTGSAGTCTAVTTTTVNVNQLPNVTFDLSPNQFCNSDSSVTLAATPAGGTFSGTSVTTNTFNAKAAGVGTYTLSYSYTDGNNCINTDTAVVSVVDCSMGIINSSLNTIRIYPNPASNYFYVENKTGSVATIEVYDVSGRKVVSQKTNETLAAVNSSLLDNGIYLVRILIDGTATQQNKIIKQ
ncbi:MAG: NHL domain-containing protein [Bacteroidia bacterium]